MGWVFGPLIGPVTSLHGYFGVGGIVGSLFIYGIHITNVRFYILVYFKVGLGLRAIYPFCIERESRNFKPNLFFMDTKVSSMPIPRFRLVDWLLRECFVCRSCTGDTDPYLQPGHLNKYLGRGCHAWILTLGVAYLMSINLSMFRNFTQRAKGAKVC